MGSYLLYNVHLSGLLIVGTGLVGGDIDGKSRSAWPDQSSLGNRQSWPTTRGSKVSICFRHHDEVTVQFSYAAATHISSISLPALAPPPPREEEESCKLRGYKRKSERRSEPRNK